VLRRDYNERRIQQVLLPHFIDELAKGRIDELNRTQQRGARGSRRIVLAAGRRDRFLDQLRPTLAAWKLASKSAGTFVTCKPSRLLPLIWFTMACTCGLS
jgi:hypothetical protein